MSEDLRRQLQELRDENGRLRNDLEHKTEIATRALASYQQRALHMEIIRQQNDDLEALANKLEQARQLAEERARELEAAAHQTSSVNEALEKEIAERKRTEEKLERYAAELQESNKDVMSFAYIISHDLRAPLVSIKGFSAELSALMKDLNTPLQKHLPGLDPADREEIESLMREDVPAAVNFISSSVTRMDRLIDSILNFSRLGRRVLKPEPLDMHGAVSAILDSLTHQITERRVEVEIDALPSVTADRLAMEQVLGNLIDNALKYLDPARPGRLKIAAEPREGDMVIHVRDNGRGIAQEDLPKVFEIFKRVGKQDVPGEGMGLAYVKALVKRHGGHIWCESELGKGTTFSFTIPEMARQSDEPGAHGGLS